MYVYKKYETVHEVESAIEDYEREAISKFSRYRKNKEIGAEGV